MPDTLDGRFDLVGLHVFLVIRRLQAAAAAGPRAGPGVFDAMFNDMDVNLREMGVGDLSVGKQGEGHVGGLPWPGHGLRAGARRRGPRAALAAALPRNVWRGAAAGAGPDRLAAIVRAQDAHLAGQDLLAGRVAFLPLPRRRGQAP